MFTDFIDSLLKYLALWTIVVGLPFALFVPYMALYLVLASLPQFLASRLLREEVASPEALGKLEKAEGFLYIDGEEHLRLGRQTREEKALVQQVHRLDISDTDEQRASSA